MASKTISVREDVYELLSRVRGVNESFSETITRLIKSRGRISECAGLWRDMDDDEFEEIRKGMRNVRESLNKRLRGA